MEDNVTHNAGLMEESMETRMKETMGNLWKSSHA
jgi:hypothetical protein